MEGGCLGMADVLLELLERMGLDPVGMLDEPDRVLDLLPRMARAPVRVIKVGRGKRRAGELAQLGQFGFDFGMQFGDQGQFVLERAGESVDSFDEGFLDGGDGVASGGGGGGGGTRGVEEGVDGDDPGAVVGGGRRRRGQLGGGFGEALGSRPAGGGGLGGTDEGLFELVCGGGERQP